MKKASKYMAFLFDTGVGRLDAIVLADGTDKDARTDAFSVMIAELGRNVRIKSDGRRVAKLPDGAWESRLCRGWGWVAKAD